ncbi:MAG: glycogen debranching N-terminal domain-containing protein [Chloroflexota bacterium]
MARMVAAQRPVRSGAELDPRYPRQLLLHEGYTYLLTAMDGSIGAQPEEGLFDHDLRLLSWHRVTVAGEVPVGAASAPIHGERWVGILGVRPRDGSAEGPRLPQDVLELRIDRRVGCGLVERLEVTNHSMASRRADLEVTLGTGFRDVSELRDEEPLRGETHWTWKESEGSLTVRWTASAGERSMERGLRVRVLEHPTQSEITFVRSESEGAERFLFQLPRVLGPHERFRLTLVYESLVDGVWRSPVDGSRPSAVLRARDDERGSVRATRPRVETSDELAGAVVERALDDILALRNWDLEGTHPGWIVNAGAPKYLGFFGRDALTVGRQSIMFGPGPLRGALERAGLTQGRLDFPDRDEEPGRIVHEMRRGPLADLALRPFGRYYGSLTGAAAFVLGLYEYWAWTGDRDTTGRLLVNASAALDWAARASERHPAGLLASVQRAPHGLRHQGWKDSDEAVRGPDGSAVPTPSAPVEEQGWWSLALDRAAVLMDAFDEPAAASRYRSEAERIRRDVEERFWVSDLGTYAVALGPSGEAVESIASDPLHLLAAGVPAADRARRVADRLFAPDMWTGWGVRTLSSEHPAYDPFAYHLGSVWPVETAAFAEGCRRYDLRSELEVLASAMFASAAHCHQLRLPEVFAGHGHEAVEVPTVYPSTQTPQAWSAGAVLSIVRSMLGLDADAEHRRLIVDRPLLPSWLPALRLLRVPICDSTVDLEFERRVDGSVDWRVLDSSGPMDVVARVPAPTAGPA